MAKIYATPGVYLAENNELNASLAPVATAIPAFIGYTEKASFNEKDLTHKPTRISSFAAFLTHFGAGPKTLFQLETPGIKNEKYALTVQANTRFLLYYSIQLFFANGGGDCYIVSIGNYSSKPILADFDGSKQVNGSTEYYGLQTLKTEPEPTLIVIPDAIWLGENAGAVLQQAVLAHCQQMGTCFAILDVFMDKEDLQQKATQDIIAKFRKSIGQNNLSWGAAYYPWLNTAVSGLKNIDFHNLENASRNTLQTLLLTEVDENVAKGLDKNKAAAFKAEIQKITTIAPDSDAVSALHQNLLKISPLYKSVMGDLLEMLNVLPPGAAVAGIYTMIDNQFGVWKAAANTSLNLVTTPVVNLNQNEQIDLSSPLDGKAVNPIRTFPGQGVLIWGARTLDGNSLDWRYINVRRTLIFIEQSITQALTAFVFEPNDANTWARVNTLISNFLTTVWRQGGLAGAAAADAFSVDIGLGVTMTAADILEGNMYVTIKIAMVRPAEFIVITLQQKMQKP